LKISFFNSNIFYLYSLIGDDNESSQRAEFRTVFDMLCASNQRLYAHEMVLTISIFKEIEPEQYQLDDLLELNSISGGTLYTDNSPQGIINNIKNIIKLN
jgi:hypothetical protein